MKIRYDFVTNSSSTSYIIINDGEFNLKTFLEAIGIDASSLFLDIYKELFHSFKRGMKPAREAYAEEDRFEAASFEEWIEKRFSNGKELAVKVIESEKNGKEVYYGQLSSDRGQVESFFCTDEFIIDSEKIYIDATQNGW